MGKKLLALVLSVLMLVSLLPVSALAATYDVNDFTALQEKLDDAESNDVIRLGGTINIPAGKSLEFDHADYTIELDVGTYKIIGAADKAVIEVKNGTLKLVGTTGEITHAGSDKGAGVVVTGGTFIMEGGSVTGNKLDSGNAAGVVVGGGIFKAGNAAKVTGNTVDGAAANVYLPSGKTIEITEALTNNGAIGVKMEAGSEGVFTSNSAADCTANFTSDVDGFVIVDSSNNAALGHTVTFDTDGGTPVPAVQKVVHNTTISAPTGVTKTGYQFAAWDYDFSNAITANTTVTASWTKNTYKVNYVAGEGGGKYDTPQTGVYGDDLKVLGNDVTGFSLDGGSFRNWLLQGTSTTVTPNTSVETLLPNGGEITLVAQWDKSLFHLTYYKNAGDLSVYKTDADAHVYGTPLKLKELAEVDPDWVPDASATVKFAGWRGSATGSGAIYLPGQTYNLTGDESLYAVWDEVMVNASFQYNDGSAVVTTPVAKGKPYTLPVPTRENYIWEGWYTDAGLTTKIDDPTFTFTADQTLYGKWTAGDVKVTFNPNGGAFVDPLITNPVTWKYKAFTYSSDVPAVTKADADFAGWYNHETDGDKLESSYFEGLDTSKTYEVFAHWTPKAAETYTVTLSGTAASKLTLYPAGAGTAPGVAANTPITLTDAETVSGEKLTAITIVKADDTPFAVALNPTDPVTVTFDMPAFDLKVTGATFTKDTYHITLNPSENGTVSTSVYDAAEDTDVTLTLSPAAGYELDELTVWDGSASVHWEAVPGEENQYAFRMPGKPVTVTVTFKGIPSNITYTNDGNGSVSGKVNSVAASTAPTGAKVDLEVSENPGFDLKHITVFQTGTPANIVAEGDTLPSFTMPAYAVTVNATFKAQTNPITITQPANGTIGTDGNIASADTGVQVTLTNTPDPGYDFVSYTVTAKSDGSAVVVNDGKFTMVAGGVDVTGTFDGHTYTITKDVTEDAVGGSVTGLATEAKTGTPVSFTVTTEENYTADVTVNGGAVTVDHSGTTYTFTMPAGDANVKVVLTKYIALIDGIPVSTLTQDDFDDANGKTLKLLKDATLPDKITIGVGKTVTLDLNGYTLTAAAGKRAFTVQGTLTITDSTTAKNGAISGNGAVTGQGGLIETNKIDGGDSTLNMNAGHLINGEATLEGGAVYVGANTTFNFTGGTIGDAAATPTKGNKAPKGGGVFVQGTFTMNGANAVIAGNEATGTAAGYGGGGVYVNSGHTFTLTEGTISGNTAESGGGVLVGTAGSGIMNGGTIEANNAKYGAGVYAAGAFVMNDGTISTNNASVWGGGMFVDNATVTDVDLKGGTISGNTATLGKGVYDSKLNSTSVSGKPVIDELYIYGSTEIAAIETGTIESGASIGVLMETPGVFTSTDIADADVAAFTSLNNGYVIRKNTSNKGEMKALNTVTLTDNGKGTLTSADLDVNSKAAEGDTVNLTATPNDGYKLDKIEVDGAEISGTSFTMGAVDTTVLATFVPATYAIATDVDPVSSGNFTAPVPTEAEYLSTVTLTAAPVVGYVLDDFTIVDSASNTVTPTDKDIANGTVEFIMPHSNVTVTANFVLDTHTVDFELNGGTDATNAAAAQTVTHGEKAAKPTTDPTRNGYTFNYWYEISDDTVAFDFTGTAIVGDTTLAAKWEAKDFTVHYVPGTGATGTQTDQVITFDDPNGKAFSEAEVPATFQKEGYKVIGWSTLDEQSYASVPFEKVISSPDPYAAEMTLYAVWQLDSFTVTYHRTTADGVTAPATDTYGPINVNANYEYTPIDYDATGFDAVALNYAFVGWTTTEGGANAIVPGVDKITMTHNVDLYAKFAPGNHSVTFNPNNSTLSGEIKAVTHGEKVVAPPYNLDNYTLLGWYEDVNDEGTKWNFDNQVTRDLILVAKWQPKTVTVTFNANGGTVKGEATYTITKDVGGFSNVVGEYSPAVMEGNTFKGWFTSTTSTTQVDDAWLNAQNSNDPASPIVVYAQWEKTSYTVTLKDLAATKVTSSVPGAIQGGTVTLTVNLVTGETLTNLKVYKEGDPTTVVDQWATGTSHSFTMPAYNVIVEVEIASIAYDITKGAMTGGDVSITANGTTTPELTSATSGSVIQLTPVPAAGYKFVTTGADKNTFRVKNVDITGDTTVDADYRFTMPASRVEVTATFTPEVYAITKDATVHGTIELPNPAEAATDTENVTVTLKPDAGYSVDTWHVTYGPSNTDYDGSVTATVSGDNLVLTFKMPAGDVKVSAAFTAKEYSVTKEPATTPNGTVTVPDYQIATDTEGVTVTLTPASGYKVAAGYTVTYGASDTAVPDVIATTTTGSNVVTLTFKMPAGDVKVSASFTVDAYHVTVTPGIVGGTVAVDKSTPNFDETVTITFTPDSGYYVAADTIAVSPAGPAIDKTSVLSDPSTATFKMPANDVEVSADFFYGIAKIGAQAYPSLMDAITAAAASGSTIELLADAELAAPYTLTKSFTIDLKGHDILVTGDRAFVVESGKTLTIEDSTATASSCGAVKVTKADATAGNGGIVLVNGGTFTLNSGELTGGKVTGDGGAVYVATNASTFNMNGGKITGNTTTTGNGAGVYLFNASSMTISGAPVISGNTKGNDPTNDPANNVYINQGQIQVAAAGLESDTSIGITMKTAGTFTYNSNTTYLTYFFSDTDAYAVRQEGAEQALKAQYNVTVTQPANGTITVNVVGDKAVATDPIVVTVTPDPGYELSTEKPSVTNVVADNITDNHDGTFSFAMPSADIAISAVMKLIEYDVTVHTPIEHGTVAVNMAKADVTKTVTITIDPELGYELDTISGAYTIGTDAKTLTPVKVDDTRYEFAMVPADVEVNATFKKTVYTITDNGTDAAKGTLTIKTNGAVTGTGTIGDPITVEAAPKTGYKLLAITATYTTNNDVEVAMTWNTDTLTYTGATFTMPAGDVEVFAEWTDETTVDALLEAAAIENYGAYEFTGAVIPNATANSMDYVIQKTLNTGDALANDIIAYLGAMAPEATEIEYNSTAYEFVGGEWIEKGGTAKLADALALTAASATEAGSPLNIAVNGVPVTINLKQQDYVLAGDPKIGNAKVAIVKTDATPGNVTLIGEKLAVADGYNVYSVANDSAADYTVYLNNQPQSNVTLAAKITLRIDCAAASTNSKLLVALLHGTTQSLVVQPAQNYDGYLTTEADLFSTYTGIVCDVATITGLGDYGAYAITSNEIARFGNEYTFQVKVKDGYNLGTVTKNGDAIDPEAGTTTEGEYTVYTFKFTPQMGFNYDLQANVAVTITYYRNYNTNDAYKVEEDATVGTNYKIKANMYDPEDGYQFNGWYTNRTGTGGKDYAADDIIDQLVPGIELYAKWQDIKQYTVTYEQGYADTGVGVPHTDTIMRENAAGYTLYNPTGTMAIANPEAHHQYEFNGWVKDNSDYLIDNDTKVFGKDTPYALTGDVTFYPHWRVTEDNYGMVIFDMNGNTSTPAYANEKVYFGDKVTNPGVPASFEENGLTYTFIGWINTKTGTTWDFDKALDGNDLVAGVDDPELHLQAVWSDGQKINLYFDDNVSPWLSDYVTINGAMDDDGIFGVYDITADTTIDSSRIPTFARTNFKWIGWYFDEACTSKYDPEVALTNTVNQAYQSKLKDETDPTYPGYKKLTVFAKWEPLYTTAEITTGGVTPALKDASYATYYSDFILARNVQGNVKTPIYRQFILVDKQDDPTKDPSTDHPTELPTGLKINELTGEIYGVPTAEPKTYEFYVAVLSDDNLTWLTPATRLEITINPITFTVDYSANSTKIFGEVDPDGMYASDKLIVTVNGEPMVENTDVSIATDNQTQVKIVTNADNTDQTATLTFSYPVVVPAYDVTLPQTNRKAADYTFDNVDYTLTVPTKRNAGEDVGEYKVYVVDADVALTTVVSGAATPVKTNFTFTVNGNFTDTGAAQNNYKLTITPKSIAGVTYVITSDTTFTGKPIIPELTVTDDNAPVFAPNPVELQKLDTYNNEIGSYYTVTAVNNTNAADPTSIDKPTLTLTGHGNYEGDLTFYFTIYRRDLSTAGTVDAKIADKEYTGSQIIPAQYADYNITIKDGDTVLYKLNDSGEADFTVTGWGANTDVGDNAGSVVIEAKPNSNFIGSLTVYFNIIPKKITVTWSDNVTHTVSGSDWFYDYGATPTPTPTISGSLVGTENCDAQLAYVINVDTNVTYTPAESASWKNVGHYIAVPELTGTDVGNYQIDPMVTQAFEVKPVEVKTEWPTNPIPYALEYNGADRKGDVFATIKKNVGDVDVTADAAAQYDFYKLADDAVTYNYVTDVKDAGSYKAVLASLSPNYTLVAGDSEFVFIIEPKEVPVEWANISFDYDSLAHQPTPSVNNAVYVINPDSVAVVIDTITPAAQLTNGEAINAGSYTATAKISPDNPNYKLSDATKSQVFVINQAALTVVPDSGQAKFYGGSDPTSLQYTATGYQGNDNATTVFSGELTRAAGENVATYAITQGSLTATSNYTINFQNGVTFEIKPLTANLQWTNLEFTENGQPHVPTATVTNLKAGDSCTVTVDGAQTNAGTYTATATALSNGNYALPAAASVPFTIKPSTSPSPAPAPAPAPSSPGTGGSTTYKLTLDDSDDNGSANFAENTMKGAKSIEVTANKEVKIEVKPAANYIVDTVTYTTSKDKQPIEIEPNADGTYTLKMPKADATVKVTFKPENDNDPSVGKVTIGNYTKGYLTCDGTNCLMNKFVDLDTKAWYHDGIHYCLENGIMQGFGDEYFKPNEYTTRAQVVTVLWNIAGHPIAKSPITFVDVNEGEWFYTAIMWAAANGIVDGYGADEKGENHFGPNDLITHEQIAKILYGYAKFYGFDVSAKADISKMEGAKNISNWAYQYVEWAVGAGVCCGQGGNASIVAAVENCTRAELATMLLNFCIKVAVKEAAK